MCRRCLFYLFVGLTAMLLWGVAKAETKAKPDDKFRGMSICNVCDNPRFLTPKGTTKLQVVCPGATDPFLTYNDCPNPKARLVKGIIEVTCNGQKAWPLDTSPPPGK